MKALAFDNHPLAYRDLDEDRQVVQDARAMMREEAEAIMALSQRIDARFAEAVRILLETRGRVILTGIGKSGHIGRKIAATLASTGTAAFFVHAAEAAHGDLGMITPAIPSSSSRIAERRPKCFDSPTRFARSAFR